MFDHKGRLRHHGGFVAPGLYALGLNFMRRRKSSFMHGAEDDVRDLGSHLVSWLRESPAMRASAKSFNTEPGARARSNASACNGEKTESHGKSAGEQRAMILSGARHV